MTSHHFSKGASQCLGKMELKDQFILLQNVLKSMHSFFPPIMYIFHVLSEDPTQFQGRFSYAYPSIKANTAENILQGRTRNYIEAWELLYEDPGLKWLLHLEFYILVTNFP